MLLRLGIGGKVYIVIKRLYAWYESCLSRIKLLLLPDRTLQHYHWYQARRLLKYFLLLNIFIHDLVDELKSAGTDTVSLNSRTLECLLYAADILLLSETQWACSRSLDCLNAFSEK